VIVVGAGTFEEKLPGWPVIRYWVIAEPLLSALPVKEICAPFNIPVAVIEAGCEGTAETDWMAAKAYRLPEIIEKLDKFVFKLARLPPKLQVGEPPSVG
jgi:hypothetical protein